MDTEPDDGIELVCPSCEGTVGYDETIASDVDPSVCGCPLCGQFTDTEEWFA